MFDADRHVSERGYGHSNGLRSIDFEEKTAPGSGGGGWIPGP